MLTQQPSDTAAEAAPAQARSVEDLIAYFEGDYVPLRDAKVSIMTHAFMYGTATFEGIRGYWNAEQETLYVLFVREHLERIRNSAKMLLMEDLPSVDELVEIVLETVRRNHYREDVYIRPSFYKSTKAIGVRLHHLDHELYVITSPFGNYIDIEKGVRVMTSTWRRNADEALPARGKIVGGYVNMAFQKSEAELNGFDEALVMTPDGHASEASAANLFMVRDGVLHHAAGLGRHPRGRDPQGDPDPGRGPRDPDGGPLGGPLRAVRLRRGLPVRDGRPGQPGHRARPPRGRGPARSGRSAARSASATSRPSAATTRPTGAGSPRSRGSSAGRPRSRPPRAGPGRARPSADGLDLLVGRVLAQRDDEVHGHAGIRRPATTVAPYRSSRYFTVSGIAASAPL